MWKPALLLLTVFVLASARRIPRMRVANPEVSPDYVEANFTTYIDHYSAQPGNFSMRYFTNSKYYQTGGPLLFYCGNEGAIEEFIDATGYINNLAEGMNALIVFAEHRYFGKSLPFGDDAFSDEFHLKFLSPHQALADYAYLITHLNMTQQLGGVVALGGSYGGMLAAWFRQKYPYLVDAALAASAPIEHFQGTVDSELFNQIVTNDYGLQSTQVVSDIRTGFQTLQNLTEDEANFEKLKEVYNLCDPIDSSNATYIYDWLNSAFVYMAMTDYPYPTSFLNPMPGNPVAHAVDAIELVLVGNNSDWNQMLAMRAGAEVYYNFNNQSSCNDINPNTSAGDLGVLGWNYLACSTLIMPSGSDGVNDMFLPAPWNATEYVEQCQATYGDHQQLDYAQIMYGAATNYTYSLRGASRILFSNGSLDPWQSGAVVKNVSDTLISFTMEGAAHHLDLRTPNPLDPPDVVYWRAFELAKLKEWLAVASEEKKELTFLSS